MLYRDKRKQGEWIPNRLWCRREPGGDDRLSSFWSHVGLLERNYCSWVASIGVGRGSTVTLKEKISFARGNDFRMGTARAYAEHYFKMVLAMTNQESRVKAQICWKSVGGMTDPAG